ncbi:OLC1v1009669C4 [Oldenlandia corymbosa var. corymbosa]|uniref:OLC1v1009669C4 n=1 Tax=Oldenlandia corymbosa var. corymbosa TaxID=529605 RepID=A0AAV1DRW9_OLDCO|nr:OLC1v1009669C4 [Oldenlandia corymbosa var. corymbosa]
MLVAGMGAEIHPKRDSNGYYSIWGLHQDAKNDIWSVYQENRPQKNGQCLETTLPWNLKLDGSLEYDKEKMKQTILRHESTFRHQLQELHRLYGKQMELMNVFRRSNVQHLRLQEEASSLSHFPSQISFENPKRGWHDSDVPSMKLVFGQSSQSESSCKQSFPGVSNGKNMMPFAARDYGSSKVMEPPSSNGTLTRREVIDLEIPADACMHNEATYSREVLREVPGSESNLTTFTKDNLLSKGVKTSFFNALTDHHNSDVSRSSSLSLRKKDELADLNDPILVNDSSDSDSADNPIGLSSSWGNKKSEDKSATPDSVLNPMWKNKSLSSKGNNNSGTFVMSVESMNEMDRKERWTCDFSSKILKPESFSMNRDVYSRHSSVAFQSYKHEPEKRNQMTSSEQVWTGQRTKRKLFGVDIFEVNDESLVMGMTMRHNADKINELGSKRPVNDVKSGFDSSTGSFHSSIREVPYQNGLSLGSQLNSKHAQGNPLANCQLINNTTISDFVVKKSASVDLVKSVDSGEHLELKLAKVPRIATDRSNIFQDAFAAEYNILPADCQRKQNVLDDLSLRPRETRTCAGQSRADKNYYHLNLDSLQNCSQQFFKNSTSVSSEKLIQKPEKVSPVLGHDINDTEGNLHCSTLMLKDSSNSLEERVSEDSQLINNAADASLENFVPRHDSAGKCLRLAESLSNIDLNVTLTEEESPSSPSPPTVKLTVTKVDLEVPIVPDKQIDLSDGSKEHCEEIMKFAAEAIVAISMSVGEVTVDEATSESMQEKPDGCLQWFVDVVSTYEGQDQNNMNEVNLNVNDDFIVELIPDGMDEFEYMTLKLEDVKVDDCFPKYSVPLLENQEDEETKVTTLSRRPRRGQRGRQRKDFQRDVLPSLISLSKLEVTEDIQTFEELLKSSGLTWQSSLSRRGNAKTSRGRRRSGATSSTQVKETVCSPLEDKPVSREVQAEDKTLVGWGKRTRRLPRQRSVNGPTAIL